MGMAKEYDRFASFAERYLISRAVTFDPEHAQEQGWAALLDAKTLYAQINTMAGAESPANPPAQQAGVGNASGPQLTPTGWTATPGAPGKVRTATPGNSSFNITQSSRLRKFLQTLGQHKYK